MSQAILEAIALLDFRRESIAQVVAALREILAFMPVPATRPPVRPAARATRRIKKSMRAGPIVTSPVTRSTEARAAGTTRRRHKHDAPLLAAFTKSSPLKAAALAKVAGISTSQAFSTLGRLVRDGLVKRECRLYRLASTSGRASAVPQNAAANLAPVWNGRKSDQSLSGYTRA